MIVLGKKYGLHCKSGMASNECIHCQLSEAGMMPEIYANIHLLYIFSNTANFHQCKQQCQIKLSISQT